MQITDCISTKWNAHPPEILENLWSSDNFRECRKRTMAWNGVVRDYRSRLLNKLLTLWFIWLLSSFRHIFTTLQSRVEKYFDQNFLLFGGFENKERFYWVYKNNHFLEHPRRNSSRKCSKNPLSEMIIWYFLFQIKTPFYRTKLHWWTKTISILAAVAYFLPASLKWIKF